MYRIKLKDVEVETDSAQEATHLIQMLQKKVAKPEVKQPVVRKSSAHRSYSNWTKEQVFFLLDNLDMKFKYLVKCPELRPHTKHAIDSMRSNVKNQSSQTGVRTMSYVKEYWALQRPPSN